MQVASFYPKFFFGRENNETTLAAYLMKVTTRSSFTRLAVNRKIKMIH